MKNLILKHGLISGLLASIWLIIFPLMGFRPEPKLGMLIGYAAMLIGFSMIFIAVKKQRDTVLDGSISFGKAFQIGMYITLIASAIYVIVWLFSFNFLIPDFLDVMFAEQLSHFKQSNPDPAALQKFIEENNKFREMYKNPFINAGMTFMEIFPVGLIMTILAAFLLRRK